MEFNKSKVYTALNADEVKIGSKGYFADTIHSLRSQAQTETIELMTLTKITPDYSMSRFCTDSVSFVYFYLVEEPKEKKFRPYATEEEIMEAINLKGGAVWIKSKYSDVKYLIIGICTGVIINNERINTTDLLDSYTYLDGSPCGIEE
jgi:hypothetical protein